MNKTKKITSYAVVIALLIFAAAIFFLTKDWAPGTYEIGYGAGYYPRMLTIVLIVLTALLFIEDRVKERKNQKASEISVSAEDSRSEEIEPYSETTVSSEDEQQFSWSNLKYPAIFLGMMVLYTALLNTLGFIVDTILFLVSGMMVLKGKLHYAIIISVLFTLVIYFLFANLLKVQLPTGIIWR
ncbi:MAG: tripartite tricarboxylate transporter TctB family protein [Acetivibrionales bacterium]|jgi:hypothetical protein